MNQPRPDVPARTLKWWQALLFTIVVTGGTLGARLALDRQLGGQPTLIVFAVPIMLSAYVGGVWAGLLSTALSSFAASYFLLPPMNSFAVASSTQRWQQAILLVTGVLMSVTHEALRRARRRASIAHSEQLQTDKALGESQASYRALTDWSPEPFFVHRNGRVILANPAAVQLCGAESVHDVLGKPITDFMHPDHRQAILARLKGLAETGDAVPRMETTVLQVDGTPMEVEVQSIALVYEGEPALLTTLHDVRERKAHEREIERLNRLYAALSEVNQAIVRRPTRDALLSQVCRILVEHGGVKLAWIGMHDAKSRMIVPVASHGDDHQLVRPLPIEPADATESRGPSAVALVEGRAVVCNDMQNDPTLVKWRAIAHFGEFQSCAVFPIRELGLVAGVLNVSSAEAGFFKEQELALLSEAAEDLSFALDNIWLSAEHERAETSARDSAKEATYLRHAINQHSLIVITNGDGNITFANDLFSRVSQYSSQELVGQDHYLIDFSDRADTAVRERWTAISRGDVWKGEVRHEAKDGTHYWVDTTVVPFLNEDGSVRQFMEIGAVITERKEAELALRVAEERMRFALESAHVGTWEVDCTTNTVLWSDITEAHYGAAPGTFGGTIEAFRERVHPDDWLPFATIVDDVRKVGGDFSHQHRAVWPDGTVRMLSVAGRMILGADGKPVRAVGISLDVTEQRLLEAQFQQAQKMEAVGRLAGGVAHDFNNLLTVMLGFCELLLKDLPESSPQRQDVEEIHKAGVSAAGLTRQLLAFSRRQLVTPRLIGLTEVVTDIRAMVQRLIGEDVNVVLNLQPHLAPIMADRAQVEQVIMNLAVNARDAMPSGGVLTLETANVTLDANYTRTHFGTSAGEYVMLSVSDTGTGMSSATQARLFEPFFTTKEVGKGTGLGMATVHGIVTSSGGHITVHSDVGVGTSFKAYFPKAREGDDAADLPTSATQHAPAKRTVLVVEDADALRELTRRMLELQGYSVQVAANAREAGLLFAANPDIDLLLTDVVMPGLSGPELASILVARRPTLRVIYMSGYTDDAIVQHGVFKPGIALLNKPFTSDTLARKIHEVFRGKALT